MKLTRVQARARWDEYTARVWDDGEDADTVLHDIDWQIARQGADEQARAAGRERATYDEIRVIFDQM